MIKGAFAASIISILWLIGIRPVWGSEGLPNESFTISGEEDLRSQILSRQRQSRHFELGRLFPQSASNGGVRGGGGDDVDQEFRSHAEKIHTEISQVEFYRSTIGEKKLSELLVAIDEAIIAPVDYPLTVEVTTKNGRKLQLPRPARCTVNIDSGDMLIEVDASRFRSMTLLKKRRLVFHEYLCLVGLETTSDYRYSNGLYADSVLLPSLADLGLIATQLQDFRIPRFVSENCILRFYQTLSDVWRSKNKSVRISFETGSRLRLQSEQCMEFYIALEAQNIPKKMESNEDELEKLTFITRILQLNYLIYLNSQLMREFPNFNHEAARVASEEEKSVKSYNREFLATVINEVNRVLSSTAISGSDRIRFGFLKTWLDFLNEQPVLEN